MTWQPSRDPHCKCREVGQDKRRGIASSWFLPSGVTPAHSAVHCTGKNPVLYRPLPSSSLPVMEKKDWIHFSYLSTCHMPWFVREIRGNGRLDNAGLQFHDVRTSALRVTFPFPPRGMWKVCVSGWDQYYCDNVALLKSNIVSVVHLWYDVETDHIYLLVNESVLLWRLFDLWLTQDSTQIRVNMRMWRKCNGKFPFKPLGCHFFF